MRGIRRYGAVVLLAAITAGCSSSGGDDAKPSSKLPSDTNPATTSAAPTSTSPTASSAGPSPTPPALISQQTPAGAKATAEYFVQTVGETYARSNTARLKALALPDCRYCHNIISDIDAGNSDGHPIALNTSWILHQTTKYSFNKDNSRYVADVTSGQTRYYDEKTRRERLGDPPLRVRLLIQLNWSGASWAVREVNRIAD